MGATEAAMGSLLSKLGQLLSGEYTMIRGVNGDLKYINHELTTMQSFLRNYNGSRGELMKDWMKQIRDVTYEVEDCVDDIGKLIRGLPSNSRCYSLLNEMLTWSARRDIASKLSDLKTQVKQIGERRDRYDLVNLDETGHGVARFDVADNHFPGLLQFVTTREPVGVEKLMGKPEKRVTCIVGFGGVGKTAIATALYRKSGEEYGHRAMVTVSQSTDLEAVLRIIRDQFKPHTNNPKQDDDNSKKKNRVVAAAVKGRSGYSEQARGLDLLKEEIVKHLNGSRYLVLIDDVWSAVLLDSIINALPQDLNSRILVTTRINDVATSQREADIRLVDHLTEEESKKLFMQAYNESKGNKNVFTQPQAPTPTSKSDQESSKQDASETEGDKSGHDPAESSKQAASQTEGSEDDLFPDQVWKICGGVPLSIITMAGRVACNPDKPHQYWEEVCESIFPESEKYGMQSLTKEEKVGRIVSHCYNDMPAEIQICSIYLSIFPKGYKISKKRLTRRWIAEGIICEKDGLSVHVIAEIYFNRLVRRKVIRPVEHSVNGKVKKCVVNDMVFELIVKKSSQDNFTSVFGGNWFMQLPSSKIRRLSLQDSDSTYLRDTENMNLSSVRSLTIFGNLKNQLPSHSIKFRIVQVLDLEGCKGFKPNYIDEICKMLFLKYLSLRKTDAKLLPSSIANLRSLETLDIRETEVVELPKSVCYLECLVNILGGDKITRKALRFPADLNKRMKALQTLSGIEIVEGTSELRHMTMLKKLAIYKIETMLSEASLDALRSSIESLGGSLQTLIVYDDSSNFVKSLDDLSSPPKSLVALELYGKMIKVPKWIKQLSVLNKLTLSLTALRSDNLKDLSNLDALLSLTFCFRTKQQDRQTLAIVVENKLDCNGVIMVPDGGFRSLKIFCLCGPLLPLLSFSNSAMPELERLEIWYNMLEGVFGAENLAKLKEVHLTSDEKDKEDMNTKEIVSELCALKKIDGTAPKVVLHQRPIGMKPKYD